jgi:CheY-like chemotaxis protein
LQRRESGARVLVVDDEETIRQLAADALSDEGYDVLEAANGAAALTLAREFPPAVIVLDMRMPVLDGWQFTAHYRSFPAPRAPIVCMTAARDAKAWAQEIGADAVLAKPFDLDDLVNTVSQLVEQSSRAASHA